MRVSFIGAAIVEFDVSGQLPGDRGLAGQHRRGSGSTKAARLRLRLADYDSSCSSRYSMARTMARIARRMRIRIRGDIGFSFLLVARGIAAATSIYVPTHFTRAVSKRPINKGFSERLEWVESSRIRCREGVLTTVGEV